MNEEGEYVVKTQCGFCKYKEYSPRCICQTKGKCENFKKSHSAWRTMVIKELLIKAEDSMDWANGEFGDEGQLCIFCRSNDWNRKEGIVHTKDCPMTKLRAKIYSHTKASQNKTDNYIN